MYNLNIQLPARLAFYVAIRIYSLFVMCPIFLGLRLAPPLSSSSLLSRPLISSYSYSELLRMLALEVRKILFYLRHVLLQVTRWCETLRAFYEFPLVINAV